MKLQPKIVEIRRRWGNDQEKVNTEQSRLYLEEGISPWAPLLPSFAQIPIFIALYRSIQQLSTTDPHFAESFLWIPSLAGPNPEGAAGLTWLVSPDMDLTTKAIYMLVPLLLVGTQVINIRINQPDNMI